MLSGGEQYTGQKTTATKVYVEYDIKAKRIQQAPQKIFLYKRADMDGLRGVHTITKKHYIPESTFIYQKTLRKHMQGGIYMPCELLFYVCWIIKMYTCGKKRYTILKCDEQMIIELTIYVQIISCYCFIKSHFRNKILILNTYVYLL